MSEELRILILEDRPADAELMLREVRREGLECTALRVETEEDFRRQLQEFRPSLILSDFSLPTYDGMSALAAVQHECPDVPFIFVSGTTGEDTAVESLHRGATDYILKERLSRLGAAVRRALLEAEKRHELNRAEEKIRDLSRFPSENPNPILRIARDGTLLYINEAGLSLLPQWHLEVGHASPPLLREAVLRSFDSGSTRMFDLEHSEQVYSFVIAPIVAGGYASLYGRDVTERKRSEEALRDSENRYRTLVDNLPQRVFLKDGNSAYVSVNELYARDLNVKAVEAAGKTDFDFFPKELAEKYRADDARIMASGRTEEIDEDYIHAGQRLTIHTVKTPVRDQQGSTTGVLGIFWDITEQKRVEDALTLERAALRKSEARYRAVTESATVAVVTADSDEHIVGWNTAAERIFGYTAAEVIGQPLTLLMPHRYRERHLPHMNRARPGGEPDLPDATVELVGVRKNRNVFPMELSVAHWETSEGAFVTRIIRDITQRKQTEEALRQSHDLLDQTGQVAKVGGWELDVETQAIRWTREVYRIHEVDPVIQPSVAEAIEFYAPDARPLIAAAVQAAVDAGTPFDLELPMITARGRHIWVRAQGAAERRDGKTIRLFGAFQDITERRQAEEALRESQARLQLISDNVLDLVALISLDGTYVYVSPSFETVLGYPPHRLIGTSAFVSVHPEDLERVQAAFAEAMQQGMGRVEFQYRHADGHYVWVDARSKVFIDEAGAPIGVVLSARDVTERKQSEDQRLQSQQRFRTIFDEAPLGMALIDSLTGSICEANARFAEIAGRTRAEMAAIGGMSITHPDDVQEDLSNMAMMNAGKIPGFGMTKRYRRPDGSDVWINMTIAPLAAEDTAHPRHVCMIEDITERRLADESRRLQSAALHATADAIVITDRAGVIVWVNPAFTQLTGYTAEEAIGKNPQDLVKSDKHTAAFYRNVWETIGAGRSWHGEMINRRKDGGLYTEEQSVTPILDASGDITHFVAIKEDVTERLQLEAQFRQAQKMESVGQLASGIAHDFNNLLTVINGTAELVLAQVGLGDLAHSDVQEILHAGERAAMLTRQLLAFSRQQILEPRVLDFNTLVAGMESLLRRLLGEDVDMVVVTTPEVARVNADPGQIEQVITNLAVNARDAMPQGGKLTVETQIVEIDDDYARQNDVDATPGSYVMLVVSDSGVGMDEATRRRIFEPFYTTKDPGKGTGLGLSTVFGIVKQSHGFIGVYSEVGHGTSFKIFLPRVTEATRTDRAEPTVVSTSGTETILLAEDNAGLRKLATRVLESAGYTVLGAATGEEALRRLLEDHKEPVHLLLSDVVMPGMSGRHLAEQVAQTHPGMKVLYMSGYASDTMVRHGVLEAKMAFLNKPFTSAALLRKVREVLDSRA